MWTSNIFQKKIRAIFSLVSNFLELDTCQQNWKEAINYELFFFFFLRDFFFPLDPTKFLEINKSVMLFLYYLGIHFWWMKIRNNASITRTDNLFCFWPENAHVLLYCLNVLIPPLFPICSWPFQFLLPRVLMWLAKLWPKFCECNKVLGLEANIRYAGIKGNGIYTCDWVLLRYYRY